MALNPQSSAWKPQPGLQIPELFSGPHFGTFFCTFFVAFPGNSSNNVDPADPTLFETFPGNATNNVGSAGSTLFEEILGNATRNVQKKVPEWGPEKSSGNCRPAWGFLAPAWAFGAKFDPDLIFKLGRKHQKWSEMTPESTVRAETWSRSMPGPLRSLWEGSNPLQGAVPGEKSQKVCPKTARGFFAGDIPDTLLPGKYGTRDQAATSRESEVTVHRSLLKQIGVRAS